MASLRARLIAGLVVVAALGLLIAAAITYAEQHEPGGREQEHAGQHPGPQRCHQGRGA